MSLPLHLHPCISHSVAVLVPYVTLSISSCVSVMLFTFVWYIIYGVLQYIGLSEVCHDVDP